MPKEYKRKTPRRKDGRSQGVSAKPRQLPAVFKLHYLDDLDRRSVIYKELKNNLARIIDEVGGEDESSLVGESLAEHFVFLNAYLRAMRHQLITGEVQPEQAEQYLARMTSMANSMTSIARIIGINKKAGKIKWTGPIIPELIDNRKVKDV